MLTILVVEPLPQLAVTLIYPWTMVRLQSIINSEDNNYSGFVSVIPVSLLMVVVVVDTTAAVGGEAAVNLVTTRLLGRRFLLLPQIPNLIQQTTHTGVMIGRNMHTRARMTAPAIMPTPEEATYMIANCFNNMQ